MVKGSLVVRRTTLLLSIALSGCNAAPGPRTVVAIQETQGRPEIERYLPLENGTVFSYDTTSEATGAKGVLIVQISRPRQDRVDLRMGAKTERLEITNEGVAYIEGGYLLKAPVLAGGTWKSKTGTVRIESADAAVRVPAGQFESCVRTVEETREPGASRAVRTVFCPHVGLVSIEVEATSDRGLERETAVLRSFGPRVDIAPGNGTTTTTTDDQL
jgi:hypothetical protein